MKNILHISDFHISGQGGGFAPKLAESVVNALKKDVESISERINGSIDALFVTGDLTFSGKSQDFDIFKNIVIDDLSTYFGISHENIFLVPGNHDCDRGVISRTEKPFRDKQEFSELDALCADIQKNEEGWPRIDSYSSWFDNNFSKRKNIVASTKLVNIYKINNKLFIIGMSSAWLAQDNFDQGKLIIGESQLKLIKDKIPRSATTILLMHHPIDWLHPEEESRFSRFVEKRINVLFFGHMHEFRQSLEANFQYDITLRLQAGTFDFRHDNAGYSIVSLQNENDFTYGEVYYRKYNKGERRFESWIERGSDGVFQFSTTGDLTFDKHKFSESSEAKLNEINNI